MGRCAVSLAEKGEVWCLASLFALGLDPLCRHPDSGDYVTQWEQRITLCFLGGFSCVNRLLGVVLLRVFILYFFVFVSLPSIKGCTLIVGWKTKQ